MWSILKMVLIGSVFHLDTISAGLRIQRIAFTEKMNVNLKMVKVVLRDYISFHCESNSSVTNVSGERSSSRTASRDNATWSIYSIVMTDSLYGNRKTILCALNVSSSDTHIRCIHRNTHRAVVSDRYVTVTVSETQQDSNSSSIIFEEKLNLIEWLQPAAVTNLSIYNTSSSVTIVQFRPSKSTLMYVRWMKLRGKPLHYEITLTRNDGPVKIVQVQFNKTVFSGNDLIHHMDQIVGVQFRNLTPFTNYTLSVVSIGGGGESRSRQLVFTTNKTAPLQPPDIDGFNYQRVDHLTSSANNTMVIYVYWRPLPMFTRGGEIVQYKMELNSKNGFNDSFISSETFAIFTVPSDSLHVKLWSVNEVGQSSNSSSIYIAGNESVLKPKACVEFDRDDHGNVYVQLPVSRDLYHLAILWCHKTQFMHDNVSAHVCQEYPNIKLFPLNSTSNSDDFIISHKVVLYPKKKATMSIYQQPLQYFDFELTNQTLNDFRVAMANVTEISLSETRDVASDLGNVTDDDDDDDVTLSLGSGDFPNPEDGPVLKPPQFFLSVNINGQWQGLNFADCYFDSSKNEVNLDLIQSTDASGNNVLRFIQKCDSDIAKQFLVKFYEVYSSVDETCTEGHKLCEVNNTLFHPAVCPLTGNRKFVCVLARAGDKSFTVTKALYHTTGETKLEVKTVILISCLTVGLFLVLGAICLIVACRRRRAHFAATLGPLDYSMSHYYESSRHTVTGYSQESSLYENNNPPNRQVSEDGERGNNTD